MYKQTASLSLITVLFLTVGTEAAQYSNSPYIYNNYYKQDYVKKRPVKKKRVIKKRVKRVKRVKRDTLTVEPKRRVRTDKESKYHIFLGEVGQFFGGIEVGQTDLSRSVVLNSKSTGETLYRTDNNNEIGPADGTTYTFNQSFKYNRLAIVAGFQERNTGDFYQVSYYTNDLVQDLLFTLGYSFKKFGYKYLYSSIPFLKIDAGFGHTGTTNGLPTNFTLGIGTGLYKNYNNYQLKAMFGYQKRNWFYLDKDIGKEKWEDSETTLSIGATYFF